MSPLRLFVWRYQRAFAVAYVGLLVATGFAVWFYRTRVPASVDTGLTVAMRSVYHGATFRQVELAERDLTLARDAVDATQRQQLLDRAEDRLEAFLDAHPRVQPDRLYTQAIVAATELVAGIYTDSGRHGRAARQLDDLAAQIPGNYRLHWLAGLANQEDGDLLTATECLQRAFRLAINHAAVTADYLDLLAEQSAFRDIVQVAEEFERGVESGRPSVELKVGVGRGGIQRKALELADVPVEHGSYSRSVTMFQLERGTRRTLNPPGDLFDDWGQAGALFVQARFENVYDGVTVHALRYLSRDGGEHELVLDDSNTATFHRPHSGVEAYVEVRTEVDSASVRAIELVYSCAEQELGERTQDIIARAIANVEGMR